MGDTLKGKWLDRGTKELWHMDIIEDGYINMISEKGECQRWLVKRIKDAISKGTCKIVDSPIRDYPDKSIYKYSEGDVLNTREINVSNLGMHTYFLHCTHSEVPWCTKGITYVFESGVLSSKITNFPRNTTFKITGIYRKEVDKGEDLIGKKVLIKNIVRTLESFKEHTGNLELTRLNGEPSYCSVKIFREKVSSGKWKMLDDESVPKDLGKDLIGLRITRGSHILYEFIDRVADDKHDGSDRVYIKALNGANKGVESRHKVKKVRDCIKQGVWEFSDSVKRDLSELSGKYIHIKGISGKIYNVDKIVIGSHVKLNRYTINVTYRIEEVYKNIDSGKWTVCDTVLGSEVSNVAHETEQELKNYENHAYNIAKHIYEEFIKSGWSREQLLEVHPRTVKDYYLNNCIPNCGTPYTKVSKLIAEIARKSTDTPLIKQHKEKIMNNSTNEVVITVPMSPYAVTETVTMFGKKVNVKSEEELTSLIARIGKEQSELKELNKNAKSKRITGQINKYGEARTKVVTLLDALPDES